MKTQPRYFRKTPVYPEDDPELLKQEIRAQQDAVKQLQQALRERDEVIHDLKHSWSWKITAPLRYILDVALMIFRRFRIDSGIPVPHTEYTLYRNKTALSKFEVFRIKNRCRSFAYKPLISIVTPVYNVDPKWLDRCILSVVNQYYPHWELCLYDDASTRMDTRECVTKWVQKDVRIKAKFGTENQHISGASNAAIKLTTGEFIGLLDNDDELTPDALYEVVKRLNINPQIDFFYSDEDKVEIDGTYTGPYFKPDFNKDLFLSNNYLCHFAVMRKKIGNQIGWFRKGYEGAQDYDLFLRYLDHTSRIEHIPKVLYHWRRIPGSTALTYDYKGYAHNASLKALDDYMERNHIDGKVEAGLWPGSFRIRRAVEKDPLISIIIPFKDQVDMLKRCVESIIRRTKYRNYEILLISNNSTDPETFEYLDDMVGKHPNCRYYKYDIPFNFSRLNNWAVRKAEGDYVVLLNNDTEVISNEWLTAMLEQSHRDEVGAVGAKLLFKDNSIQHAGVVLGIGGVANHAFLRSHTNDNRYFGNLNVIRNYSACSAACLMVKKKVYLEVGGLDEKNLHVAYVSGGVNFPKSGG